MEFVLANLRLKELVDIVNQNEEFYHDFVRFLAFSGYPTLHAFVRESDDAVATKTIESYLKHRVEAKLYDGIGRAYADDIAKWYLLAWILRDAPAQRLGPLLKTVQGATLAARRATLINEVRKFVGPIFPEAEKWTWATISEVMLARLEGSRRALKGTTFEETVRNTLRAVLKQHDIKLKVGDQQIRLHDETYDVQLIGSRRSILIPVKTRETMGGGHANLFTRDIFKAVQVAHSNNYECVPIVIAESWSGDLETLSCKHTVHLPTNPNQTEQVAILLDNALQALVIYFKEFE